MAIFDWSLQTIKRSAERAPSRSAVAAAAYRSGTYLRDHRTGAEHDFTRRRGIFSEIVLPPGIKPPILVHPGSRLELRSRLWNAAEAAETRCNSVVAREITLALPHELPQEACRRLVRAFAGYVARSFGVAADLAVHPPSRNGDQRNIHAHVLFTTRRVSDGFEFGEKTRELDAAATGGPIIKALREKWADFANLVLLDAGLNIAIDHRSLADRGIDRAPGHHIGPEATNRARGLRAIAARLEAEAEEIEREVLPLLWPQVHAEAIVPEPQHVEEAWMEWALLYKQKQRADSDEIDEDAADMDRRPGVVVYEPPPFDWVDYDADRFRAWARGEPPARSFEWSEYRPDKFQAWAGKRWPEKHAEPAKLQFKIVSEGDIALSLPALRSKDPGRIDLDTFPFLKRFVKQSDPPPEEKPVERKPEIAEPAQPVRRRRSRKDNDLGR